jgi:hypothetical protein
MSVLPDASPYLAAGWPWWWLLLVLQFLLLLILLTCLLLWCLRGNKRHDKRTWVNGQRQPLLTNEKVELRPLETGRGGKGEFADGYTRGFRDASQSGPRRRLDGEYAKHGDRFGEGYAKGMRDAGGRLTGSQRNLAQRPSNQGYSAGYMQGFRDGNSGTFGDRITESLLKRLQDQYPDNDEFRQGYLDGFKEGGSRGKVDSHQIHKSLNELTDRLTSLEKTQGDEIHKTKIYHVYNQGSDVDGDGNTLRRHYTPGDYLKYASDTDAYNSIGRTRRSQSASALGRGQLRLLLAVRIK